MRRYGPQPPYVTCDKNGAAVYVDGDMLVEFNPDGKIYMGELADGSPDPDACIDYADKLIREANEDARVELSALNYEIQSLEYQRALLWKRIQQTSLSDN